MKKWFGLILIFLSLMIGLAAQAQTAVWSAWMYENQIGVIERVDSNGAIQQTVTLPLLPGFDSYAYNVDFSLDGSQVAYRLSSSQTGNSVLAVYNVISGLVTAQYPVGIILGDGLDFSTDSRIFSDTGNTIAYSYWIGTQWAIIIMETSTGNVLFQLNSTDSIAQQASITSDLLPIVQRYVGGEVGFTMSSLGEPLRESPSYRWDLSTGNVFATSDYPFFLIDIFTPTGEAVMSMQDIRFPNRLDQLDYPYQSNTLRITDPRTGENFPIFQRETWSIVVAYFVNGGQQILFNANDLENGQNLWALIDRSVTVVNLAPVAPTDLNSIQTTADGFLFLMNTDAGTELHEAKNANGVVTEDRIVTTFVGRSPRIVWSQDTRLFTGQIAAVLPAWSRLSEPAISPAFSSTPIPGSGISPVTIPTITPLAGEQPQIVTATPLLGGLPTFTPDGLTVVTATPQGQVQPGSLVVGGSAFINTTEGDSLNMRGGPGISFEIVAQAENGDLVVLLEGPVPADGFTWWRIRKQDGITGWVVQRADNVDTLIPSQQ